MSRKNLPSLFMLTAGAVMCIITYVMNFSVLEKLVYLFVVLVVFGIMGGVLQWTLDHFEQQNEELRRSEEAEKEEEEAVATEEVQI